MPKRGSKRDIAMQSVKTWLLKHPKGGTYHLIAQQTGLTVQAVMRARRDLDLFDPTVVSIPAPRNGYLARAHWNKTAQQGEGNQLRHLATRAESEAVRLEKAAPNEPDPVKAALMRLAVVRQQSFATEMRQLAEMFG